jgi:hypothetical protein
MITNFLYEQNDEKVGGNTSEGKRNRAREMWREVRFMILSTASV